MTDNIPDYDLSQNNQMDSAGIMDTKERDRLDFIHDNDLSQNIQMDGARKKETKEREVLEFFPYLNFDFSQNNQMDSAGIMDTKERDRLDFIHDNDLSQNIQMDACLSIEFFHNVIYIPYNILKLTNFTYFTYLKFLFEYDKKITKILN
ncbi:hypothetical protein BpHYR1_044092 [Brachionus plicatilis]|uniref:Uncharacterized protein n=1 Tax=Brachionus plicatilis TaxID=10195 RepID=A0A3M7RP87_BRAPC|nr:hypothetical protein BpHYR1_044092 [Brachionus plicatilis]